MQTGRCEASGRLESRRLFILLDLSRGALVCCVPIDRSVCVAPMHLEQVCCVWRYCASETKLEMYYDVRPGSVLAL